MFINHCFELGNETISLTTNLKNKRAQHVYEKLGFKVDKITYGEWEDQLGCPQNTVYYSLVKKDFNDFADYNYQIQRLTAKNCNLRKSKSKNSEFSNNCS